MSHGLSDSVLSAWWKNFFFHSVGWGTIAAAVSLAVTSSQREASKTVEHLYIENRETCAHNTDVLYPTLQLGDKQAEHHAHVEAIR